MVYIKEKHCQVTMLFYTVRHNFVPPKAGLLPRIVVQRTKVRLTPLLRSRLGLLYSVAL